MAFWSREAPAARADDLLVEVPVETAVRWNFALICFMRVLSAIWLAKGVIAWTVVLGITGGPPAFEDATIGFQAAMVYFAVIDLVAGVGLWLASTWGGVLWLLAVMSHLILAVFFPRFVSNSTLVIALFIVGIMMYLTISWLASIDE